MKNLTRVMLWKDAVDCFNSEILPMIQKTYEKDGIPDRPARSEAWNDWTDSLCKDGEISDWQYDNWSQPSTCDC
jgi:hypothetical protein